MQLISFNKTTINWFFSIYTIGIILLCTLPINSSKSGLNDIYIVSVRLDYITHLFLFIPWMFLWRKLTNLNFKKEMFKSTLLIISSLLFAFGSELIQYYLPFRAYNINDLIANGVGVGIGAIFFMS